MLSARGPFLRNQGQRGNGARGKWRLESKPAPVVSVYRCAENEVHRECGVQKNVGDQLAEGFAKVDLSSTAVALTVGIEDVRGVVLQREMITLWKARGPIPRETNGNL